MTPANYLYNPWIIKYVRISRIFSSIQGPERIHDIFVVILLLLKVYAICGEREMSMDKAGSVRNYFRNTSGVVILLSGGVDSAVLAVLASQGALSPVAALTFKTPLVSNEEIQTARNIADKTGLDHHIIDLDVTQYPDVKANDTDRCYYCRKAFHREAISWARNNGYGPIVDGVQADEISTPRPGLRAACEDGIIHPLAEAGLTKNEIRAIARKASLPNAGKPAAPCLATRFPPGVPIDALTIKHLKNAETALAQMGFRNFRVRYFPPGLAMLEMDGAQMDEAWMRRDELIDAVKNAGFPVVSMDLEGLERGKMDRFLEVKNHDPD